ncbi:MAG: helix-turn-helix transcriptional regulator [Oligoflexia bacterium]|nr:helix-turn-helix transcriptional regulator [Oligoflexia bacterium]
MKSKQNSCILKITPGVKKLLSEIADSLIATRKRRRISVSMAAKAIGIDRRTISAIEKGNPRVSLGAFLLYINYFDFNKGFLLIFDPSLDYTTLRSEISRARRTGKISKGIDKSKVDF